MLTSLVELILAFFISNYESNKYPYLAGFLKGIILGIASFILGVMLDFINNDVMGHNLLVLYFFSCIGIGFILGLFFMFLEWWSKS